MGKRWWLANISGAIAGIGFGIVIARALLLLASRPPNYQYPSDSLGGWCSYIPILIATASGALGAVIGYALRQRLAQLGFIKKNAILYAIGGALLWPIVGALYAMVLLYLVAPLIDQWLPDRYGRTSEPLIVLGILLSILMTAILIGSLVAMLRKKEAQPHLR